MTLPPFACPDWRDRLFAGTSLMPKLALDQREAARALKIFNRLRLYDVAGYPTLGEAGGDWFREIVAAVFGSLDPVSGIRQVANVLLLVPKKNSKTTNSAGLMVTALLMNRRPNALFGLFGPTQSIAETAYDAAAGMIECDGDGLKELFKTQDHLKRITNRSTGAELKISTFDPAVATGKKYAGWLLDELHELGETPYAERVMSQLRGARASVHESFGVIVTTQSSKPPAGIFRKELDYARRVRDGLIAEPNVLPILYELPEEMQLDAEKPWRDPAIWSLVNPNLGLSVSLDVLRADHQAEYDKGPEAESIWLSQHLNLQLGMATHDGRWEGADHWAGAEMVGSLDKLLARSEVVTVGVDGGGLDDLLALTVIGRDRETKRWLVWCHAWADHGVLTRRKSIAPTLLSFAEDGDLTFIDIGDGTNADVHGVADRVEQIWSAGLLPVQYGIGLDAFGVAAITDELALRGIPAECMAAVPQGFRLSGVIKGAARKLKDGTLRHFGQPLLAWCVGNAKAELKGSATVINKALAGAAKIDPLMAMFNAFDLMARNPAPSHRLAVDGYFASLKGAAA